MVINGTQKSIKTSVVTQEVEEYLSHSWLGIIPRKNIFFYGNRSLEKSLRTTFPKIYTIDIGTHVSEIDISIDERDAHSLWCVDKEYEVIFDEECYFADQEGYWYTRAPYFSDNVLTKIYLDPRVESIVLGDRFLNDNAFHELFVFVREMNSAYNTEIQKIIFRPQGDVELHVARLHNHVFKEPFVVWFNIKDSYERVYRNLGIVFEQEAFVGEFEIKPNALESVDVRFDGRIFYKFNSNT